ncbi:MAG: enoyl-CoA hydratase, partial [Mesorhizobium sp.]
AERAKAAGLIYDVVAEDALESAVLAAADEIAAKPPQALKIARDLMREPRDELIARIEVESAHFRERLTSDEARAALTAFMTRKKAG